MDLSELQERTAVLAPQDDAIDAALAELDRRIAAWIKALSVLENYRIDVKSATNPPARGLITGASPGAKSERNASFPERPEAAAEGTPPNAPSEDEALLASLDPLVAERVRAKWRLTGKQRSVRELLAELEGDDARRGKKRR